jgi:hypothetical protein
MATIGSLIIEIAGDNSKLRRSFEDSSKLSQRFQQDILTARREFASSAVRLREDLFSGALSPREFQQQGVIAAREYNSALLSTIQQLRNAGQLTERLHASLVRELRETGMEGGRALVQGLEQSTAVAPRNLERRFQSTVVAVAFAMEAMAEGTEGGVKRALRSISLLAFAFGPQAGGIVLAITVATQAMVEFFTKTEKAAEETMRKFREGLAEMARSGPGGLIPAAKLQQQLFSGDPFAELEGKRKDETKQQFEARRLGIEGITRALREQQQIIDVARSKPSDPGAALAGGTEALRNARERAAELRAELKTLTDEQARLGPVLAKAMKDEANAAQNKLDVAALRKQEHLDVVQQLENELSQIEQTRASLAGLHESIVATNQPLANVYRDANKLLLEHNRLLVAQGLLYDKVSLRLEEISAKALGALTAAQAIAPLLLTPGGQSAGILAGSGLHVGADNQVHDRTRVEIGEALFNQPPITVRPQAAALPPGKTEQELLFQLALTEAGEALRAFGAGLRNMIGAGAMAAFKSIIGQLNPFAAVISAINQAAAPVAPIMEAIGRVVADDLAPVFKAFVPVLEQLVPVIDAVLRVFAPIVAALAPLLAAIVPIIKALFPILKAGAIVATYLFQAFAIGASIFLRAVGNVVIGFGTIIKALATAIDKLPFVSAKGAIDAAQGIIDFGRALLTSSDDFKQSAEDMAKARDEIRNITFDETAGAVAALGEAATETADALKNVPEWWKSAAAIWEATHPRDDVPGITPPGGGATLDPTGLGGKMSLPVSLGGPGSGAITDAHAIVAGASVSVNIGNVTLAEPVTDARALMRGMIREAQRISQATFGTTARWAEVM